MTRDAIFFTFGGMAVGVVVWASVTRPIPERGKIVCHADGTAYTAHIDTHGISQADLVNAVAVMCRLRERMGV